MAGRWRSALALLLLLPTVAACRPSAEEPAPEPAPEPRAGSPLDRCVTVLVADERAPGCRGVRIRVPNKDFVPQGLALAAGGTAYVSGYDAGAAEGEKVCQIAHVDRGTGRVLDWVARLDVVASTGEVRSCLHGGGLALNGHGLWVAGVGRLWLIDPAAPDPGSVVQRVWRVDLRTKASVVAAGSGELLVGTFRDSRRSSVVRVPFVDLLASGATTLSPVPAGREVVVPTRSGGAPSRLQGITVGRGGTWLARSTTYCAELVAPGGRHLAFVPGAEGLQLHRGHVWVVSEAGSRHYQALGGGRPDVPTLSRISLDRILGNNADCW